MKRTEVVIALFLAIGLWAGIALAADAGAGKAKAGSCAGCHGANGEGRGPAGPPITNMGEAKFVAAMQDYKSGKRANAPMKSVSAGLSDTDFQNLAAYYASLKK